MTGRSVGTADRGASLALVLGLLAVLSAISVGLLPGTATGLRIATVQTAARADELAADGAANLAAQLARRDRSVAAFGTDCPTRTVTLDGRTATVACSTTTTIGRVDRSMDLTVSVDGQVRLRASVVLRDGTGSSEPPVDVTRWQTRAL